MEHFCSLNIVVFLILPRHEKIFDGFILPCLGFAIFVNALFS